VLFANTITDPIVVLTKKANLLAKGKLEQHATVKSNDEIGQLTRSFNTMARELRKNVTEVESQRDKLEVVLHNMSDGVLAFDENGILIHANKVCYDMLEIDNILVSLDWFLNSLSLDRSCIKPGGKEIVVSQDGKYISVTLVPYSAGNRLNGVIVVLHDITRHRQLDDMRKEFVANVSHEIGTPLTTIKGYAELLLDGAIDDKAVAMDFLKEIDVAADRMKLLRDDLLDLSRFDTKVNKFDLHEVDLVELVDGCVRQNVVVASQKNQTITFRRPRRSMVVMADAARVNQAITNIISNSVKYSPENATIKITANEDEKHYFINISDNGIGMPKEALDRIFERFYRVDKARSRQMGGNGLGLAIVKEIMDAHHGTIKVKSEEGKGTTMTLVFPKHKSIEA
jgi:two-component system sensor histidine kinase VicK